MQRTACGFPTALTVMACLAGCGAGEGKQPDACATPGGCSNTGGASGSRATSGAGSGGSLSPGSSSPGGAGTSGGAGSGGSVITGGSTGPERTGGSGGSGGSGVANLTGGMAGAATIDAAMSSDASPSSDAGTASDVNSSIDAVPDGLAFPACSPALNFNGQVCATMKGGLYSGKLTKALALNADGGLDWGSCPGGSLQNGFTLLLQDGGSMTVAYRTNLNMMSSMSLDAWEGKSVNVQVARIGDIGVGGAGGTYLIVTDSAGLVFALDSEWYPGWKDNRSVGSSSVMVTLDPPICLADSCNSRVGGFTFSGTSSISLAPGGVGTFQLNEITFTAYAGSWYGGWFMSPPVDPKVCADPTTGETWAIIRNVPTATLPDAGR